MNKTKRNGLLTLAALGVAYWKWGMDKDQKQKVKDQLTHAGDSLKKNVTDVTNKYGNIANSKNPLNIEERATF